MADLTSRAVVSISADRPDPASVTHEINYGSSRKRVGEIVLKDILLVNIPLKLRQ